MDISGISDKLINNSITSAKSKVADDDFQEHLKKAMDSKDEKELREACQEFESIFLSMMYKQMKASVPRSDLIPGGLGRDIFESMLDDALMQQASKRGIGLADVLYKQLHRNMESLYKFDDAGEAQNSEEE